LKRKIDLIKENKSNERGPSQKKKTQELGLNNEIDN
jgi:hypothetical protein